MKENIRKGSYLEKCLNAIKKYKSAELVINNYEKDHLLKLNMAKINDHIICTTKQAERLIPFSYENELIPSRGYRYLFRYDEEKQKFFKK